MNTAALKNLAFLKEEYIRNYAPSDDNLIISIGGFDFEITGLEWDEYSNDLYEGFIKSANQQLQRNPDFRLYCLKDAGRFNTVFRIAKPKLNKRQHLFAITRVGNSVLIAFKSAITEFDVSARNAFLLYRDLTPPVFDSTLRIILSDLLPLNKGLLLHSAALETNGGGYLFCGRSGSGKSSIAQIAEHNGWDVLGDELNILRSCKEGVLVYTTPFSGTGGRKSVNRSSYLRAIISHRKSKSVLLKKTQLLDAVKLLIENSLFFGEEAVNMDRILMAARACSSGISSFQLEFRKDDTFLQFLKDGITEFDR